MSSTHRPTQQTPTTTRQSAVANEGQKLAVQIGSTYVDGRRSEKLALFVFVLRLARHDRQHLQRNNGTRKNVRHCPRTIHTREPVGHTWKPARPCRRSRTYAAEKIAHRIDESTELRVESARPSYLLAGRVESLDADDRGDEADGHPKRREAPAGLFRGLANLFRWRI